MKCERSRQCCPNYDKCWKDLRQLARKMSAPGKAWGGRMDNLKRFDRAQRVVKSRPEWLASHPEVSLA
jgi:hypothetical protein